MGINEIISYLHQEDLLEEVVLGLSLLITIAIYTHTRYEDRKLQRAAYIRDYTLSFSQRSDLEEIFLEIDHERYMWTYDMHGTKEELRLTRLLDFLNSVGFSESQGVVSVSDIYDTTLGYAVWRVYDNPQVKRYLVRVDQHDQNLLPQFDGCEEVRVPHAFAHFRSLGDKLNDVYRPGSANANVSISEDNLFGP